MAEPYLPICYAAYSWKGPVVWSHFDHTGNAVWWCARREFIFTFQRRALNNLLMTDSIEKQLTPVRDVSHQIGAGAGNLGNLSDLRTLLVEILEP